MRRLFKLDPEKNLTHQWPFWAINGLLFTTAIILTIIIVNKGNYHPDWSPAGFKVFLSDFGFPISIAALIIPASALIATMHRSSQLSTQINLLMDQNNFANYYKHYEEFGKYIEKALDNKSDIELVKEDELRIYRSIFPKSREGVYYPSKEMFLKIDDFLVDLITEYWTLKRSGGDLWDYIKLARDIHEKIRELTCIGFYGINFIVYNNIAINEGVGFALEKLFEKMRKDISLVIEVASYERMSSDILKKWKIFNDLDPYDDDLSKIEFKSLTKKK